MDTRSRGLIGSAAFDEASAYGAEMASADMMFSQTSKGEFRISWRMLRVGGFSLQYLAAHKGAYVSLGQNLSTDHSFLIPVANPDRQMILGKTMDSRSMVVYAPGGEHADRISTHTAAVYVVPPADTLMGASEGILGRPINLQRTGSRVQTMNVTEMAGLQHLLRQIYETSISTPEAFNHAEAMRTIEQDLIATLLQAAASDKGQFHYGLNQIPRTSILRCIREHLDLAASEPVRVADLCAAAQISQPTLHRVFQDLYGLSPKRFLQIRQLNQARAQLLRSDPLTTTVSSVAFDAGFWQLSRFAHDYKVLFGESPSDTLRGTRTPSAHSIDNIWKLANLSD